MKNEMDQVEKPVTLSLCVAFIVVFRRLLVVGAIVPLMCAASPLLAGIYLAIMDFVMAGFGFLSTILAFCFSLLGRMSIRRYAPSLKKRDEALAKSRLSLPLAGFVLGRILIKYLLYPVAKWIRIEEWLMYSPSLPYMTAFRLSACMLLLGIVVLARFVGPVSVVRCSEAPLRCHPVSVSIRSFWKRCTSLDAFLGLVAAPSDKPGHLLATSFPIWQETGYRYQRPSLRASVGQILISSVVGFILPHWMPLWEHFRYDSLAQMVLIATSVLTLLAHLMVTALDGTSHELDPKLYQSVDVKNLMSFRQFPSLFSTFGSAVMVVPAVAVAVVSRYTDDDNNNAAVSKSSILSLALLALVVTVLITVYLILVNEASKVALCIPVGNIQSIVKEFSPDNSSRDELTVILESILHGNEMLVRSVLDPVQKAGDLYVKEKELKKGEVNMKSMARVLLFMDRHLESTDARLERDILCMLLLETLGGTEPEATSVDIGNLSPRHEEVVKKWAHPQNAAFMGVARREPDVVPLVRALCTYAGGLGEALQIVSLPPNAPQRLALTDGLPMTSWLLPPGARACSEWAIRGASRLIVYSLKSTQGPASDWRSSSLSILIPVMLQATFSLRMGILRYARMNQDRRAALVTDSIEIDWLSGTNKVLRPIVSACDESSRMVIKTLESMDGASQMNMPMSSNCVEWLQTL